MFWLFWSQWGQCVEWRTALASDCLAFHPAPLLVWLWPVFTFSLCWFPPLWNRHVNSISQGCWVLNEFIHGKDLIWCLTHDNPYCLLLYYYHSLTVVVVLLKVVGGISCHHDSCCFMGSWEFYYKEYVLSINYVWNTVFHHKWQMTFFSINIIFNGIRLDNNLLWYIVHP